MDITEVRVKLMDDPSERLKAFCSITIDNSFVIRDLKIIDGSAGPFVAMPSRKLTSHCPRCGGKNHLRAGFCNQCGLRLKEERAPRDDEGRAKLYADIAHPINSACRELVQSRVIEAYRQEMERAKQPGYAPHYDDYDLDLDAEAESAGQSRRVDPAAPQPPAPMPGGSPAAAPAPVAAQPTTPAPTPMATPSSIVQPPSAPPPPPPSAQPPHVPRGPHKPNRESKPASRAKNGGQFGAGIFDG
ncbi:MAG: septation protein SpoVG family protein [Planctomycetia bacterium]|nr:septation protein SpoVG family protein [Planctomycetia bacterium]